MTTHLNGPETDQQVQQRHKRFRGADLTHNDWALDLTAGLISA